MQSLHWQHPQLQFCCCKAGPGRDTRSRVAPLGMWPLQLQTLPCRSRETPGPAGSCHFHREWAPAPHGKVCPGPTGKAISTAQALIAHNPPTQECWDPGSLSHLGQGVKRNRSACTKDRAKISGSCGRHRMVLAAPGAPYPPPHSGPSPGLGAVGDSKARARLTWTAHSAPSPHARHGSLPRCLAASAGPAPSPGWRSHADGLRGHRDSVTAALPRQLEHTPGTQREDQSKQPGGAASQAGFEGNLCAQSPASTQAVLPGALPAAPGGHRKDRDVLVRCSLSRLPSR